jgi:hypothetical protein
MRFVQLTAFLFIASVIFFTSCKKSDEDLEWENTYIGTITMSGGQETPAVSTSATGTIEAKYSRLTNTLNYSITFSGLSDSAIAAHIHGTGETGIKADIMQTFSPFPRAKSGTYSGSLYIDGVKFLEAELLNDRYYINIHSKTYGQGEIRGQLILRRGPKP